MLFFAQFSLEIWDYFILKNFYSCETAFFHSFYYYIFFPFFYFHYTQLYLMFPADKQQYSWSRYLLLVTWSMILVFSFLHIFFLFFPLFFFFSFYNEYRAPRFSMQDQNLTNKLLNWLTYDNLSCAFFSTTLYKSQCWCLYVCNTTKW